MSQAPEPRVIVQQDGGNFSGSTRYEVGGGVVSRTAEVGRPREFQRQLSLGEVGEVRRLARGAAQVQQSDIRESDLVSDSMRTEVTIDHLTSGPWSVHYETGDAVPNAVTDLVSYVASAAVERSVESPDLDR